MTTKRLRLIAIAYSPWSEKARWALDHHRVAYEKEEYLPMLGEPILRLRTRRLTGRVTVPVLFVDDEAVFDSFEIAKQADQLGSGSPLFPGGALDEVRTWNELAERGLAAGRALTVAATAKSPGAMLENVPPFIPERLRPLSTGLVSMGLTFLTRKYRLETAAGEDALDDACERLRAGLGGKRHLVGDAFSFADIAMAVMLGSVKPVARARLGPASRETWTRPELARRHADLLEWRDATYAEHR
jgi:glutathione S-transferase